MTDTESHKPPDEVTPQYASVRRRSGYRMTPGWLGLIGILICIVHIALISALHSAGQYAYAMEADLGFLVAEGVVTVTVALWAIGNALRRHDAKLLARPFAAVAVLLLVSGTILLPSHIGARQGASKAARMAATAPASQPAQP